jgi:hypothetical protein
VQQTPKDGLPPSGFQEHFMIPTFTLLMTVLAGPAGDSTPPAAIPGNIKRTASEAPYGTVREAREAVKSALRDSNRASGRDAAQTAPAVLAVHRRVGVSEQLPAAERRRLQAQLNTRLSELQSTLHRREQRATATHSGGVVANAQELIDLIQTTIAPQTWEINGGQGTIFYFPNR